MKRLTLTFLTLFLSASCGSGDFRVNPSAGTLSELEGSNPTNAKDFFKQKLFPLMTASTGSKGCSNSGCHALGPNGNSGNEPFFIDASNSETSWSWAQVRRVGPVVATNFSDSGDPTLKEQIDSNHKGVNWSASEKALVNEWVNLSE